jgi:adenine-specific DNA-methyltransferase
MNQENNLAEPEFPTINFIGNKEKITSWIFDNISVSGKTFFDIFSGGCSVSYEAKKRGCKVITNDVLKINYLISKALIENKKVKLTEKDSQIIFSGKPVKGFMYENYSNVNFFPKECMELDQYRQNIDNLSNPFKKALALILFRRSMIRKMPYSRFTIPWDKVKQLRDEEFSYKNYGRRRAYHNQTIKEHFDKNVENYNNSIFDNSQDNKAYNQDIFDLIPKVKADIAYVDPPYAGTMSNYHGFYGLLDGFVKMRKTNSFENDFADKKKSVELFDKLFSKLKKFDTWVLSYNNNAFPDKKQILSLIEKHAKKVDVVEKKHNYQVSGSALKNKNREYLFVVKN